MGQTGVHIYVPLVITMLIFKRWYDGENLPESSIRPLLCKGITLTTIRDLGKILFSTMVRYNNCSRKANFSLIHFLYLCQIQNQTVNSFVTFRWLNFSETKMKLPSGENFEAHNAVGVLFCDKMVFHHKLQVVVQRNLKTKFYQTRKKLKRIQYFTRRINNYHCSIFDLMLLSFWFDDLLTCYLLSSEMYRNFHILI